MFDAFREQKARDYLCFDPLPFSKWIVTTDSHIEISTRYSEKLSALIRSIPGAEWQANRRVWHVPFSSHDAVRQSLAEIDRLAVQASFSGQEEPTTRAEPRPERESYVRAVDNSSGRPAAMQTAYLSPKQGPLFHLEIEAIGAHPPKHLAAYYNPPRREWVAQILGVDGKRRFVRAFLEGNRDYSKSNSAGSRGIYTSFQLEAGPIYEVKAPMSWRASDRFFCRIENGEIQRMSEVEVMSCLAK